MSKMKLLLFLIISCFIWVLVYAVYAQEDGSTGSIHLGTFTPTLPASTPTSTPAPPATRIPIRTPTPSGNTEPSYSFGSGYCSIENLLKYFPDRTAAQKASLICQAESGSDPFSENKSCLAGQSPGYKIGLFQIDMVKDCSGALSQSGSSCRILDQKMLDACEVSYKNPVENIKRAVLLSNKGADWSYWSSSQTIISPFPTASVVGGILYVPEARIPRVFDHGYGPIPVKRITLHWTANWAPAIAVHNYLARPGDESACSLAIDKDETIQMLPFYNTKIEKNWCSHSANKDSIGIEIVGVNFDDYLTQKGQITRNDLRLATDRALRIACWLTKQYRIPIDDSHIVGHYQFFADKDDPGPRYRAYFTKRLKAECL